MGKGWAKDGQRIEGISISYTSGAMVRLTEELHSKQLQVRFSAGTDIIFSDTSPNLNQNGTFLMHILQPTDQCYDLSEV